MKIKLAILEKDRSYLTRVVSAFGTKYADKFEIYSFTDMDVALSNVDNSRIDVLLASDAFDIDTTKLPSRCAFAYLVDSMGIEMINEVRAICKFQKADLIYKQILSVYSEKASSITGFAAHADKGNVVVFSSPCGGVGNSVMAAACAVRAAANGKKVLYLNLEKFGGADLFFDGEGQYGMSDIIFAVKSKKTNLPLKLEGCVRQATNKVFYYAQAKNALDMLELTSEEIVRLISELKLMGEYDFIIIDADFSIDKEMLKVYRQAQALVMVSDGSCEANAKIERAYSALATKELNNDAPLTNRVQLVYNRVSSKSGQSVEISGLKTLGGAPRYSGANTQQIIEQLAQMAMFDGVL